MDKLDKYEQVWLNAFLHTPKIAPFETEGYCQTSISTPIGYSVQWADHCLKLFKERFQQEVE